MRGLQRAVCVLAMCCTLYTLGAQLDDHSWAYSCVVALALVMEWLAYTSGLADGMDIYRQLTPEQRTAVERILNDE